MGEPFQQPPQQYPPVGPELPVELPKGLAVTAMVLGIVGLVLSMAGCTWFLGLPCDILGIIFGAVAISKVKSGEQGGEGMAKAGLICGIIGFVAVIFWFIFIMFWMSQVTELQNYPFRY